LSTQADINPPSAKTQNSDTQNPDVVAEREATPKNSHGHKPKERKDIASGELRDPADMLRLAFGPDGQIVPDIYAKLPGRGAWIEASREAVDKAVRAGAFARSAKRKVTIPDNFADMIEAGLSARVLGMIGMAKRAGQLESGFENVRSCARTGELAVRIEACDGQPDGRSKIRVVVKALSKELETPMPTLLGCFNSAELGKVVGRDNMVHACVHNGKMAKALLHEIDRLAGFRQLIPDDWPDREHEIVIETVVETKIEEKIETELESGI